MTMTTWICGIWKGPADETIEAETEGKAAQKYAKLLGFDAAEYVQRWRWRPADSGGASDQTFFVHRYVSTAVRESAVRQGIDLDTTTAIGAFR